MLEENFYYIDFSATSRKREIKICVDLNTRKLMCIKALLYLTLRGDEE